MRHILIFLSVFLICCISYAIDAPRQMLISKGSFIPVYPVKTLSTSVLEEGDTFYFIVPQDLWVGDSKIVPRNSIVKTSVTMLKMPVTGVNAAMKIQAYEICFPNAICHPIKGMIAYKGETQIGGDLTPPASYNISLHPSKGQYFNGAFAQYVPSGEYEFGQHITILTNETLHLVLDEDFSLF